MWYKAELLIKLLEVKFKYYKFCLLRSRNTETDESKIRCKRSVWHNGVKSNERGSQEQWFSMDIEGGINFGLPSTETEWLLTFLLLFQRLLCSRSSSSYWGNKDGRYKGRGRVRKITISTLFQNIYSIFVSQEAPLNVITLG